MLPSDADVLGLISNVPFNPSHADAYFVVIGTREPGPVCRFCRFCTPQPCDLRRRQVAWGEGRIANNSASPLFNRSGLVQLAWMSRCASQLCLVACRAVPHLGAVPCRTKNVPLCLVPCRCVQRAAAESYMFIYDWYDRMLWDLVDATPVPKPVHDGDVRLRLNVG